MSPFILIMLALGALLLWYSFTGVSPFTTVRGIVAPGTVKATTPKTVPATSGA